MKKDKKRLTILNQFFYPDYAATGQLLYSLSKSLYKKGLKINVLTSFPGYSYVKKQNIIDENDRSYKIKRFSISKLLILKRSPKLIKALIFCLNIFIRLLFYNNKKELILYTSEPLFLPVLGYFLYKLKSLNYIIILYDLYPEILIDLKILGKNNMIIKAWQYLNELTYEKSEEIIVLSKDMKNKILNNYKINPKKIKIIPSWADTEKIYPIPRSRNWFIKKHQINNKFIILYSGNQGRLHDLETLINAAKFLKNDRNFLFLFIGDGVQNKKLKEFVKSNNLDNCKFLPYQKLIDLKFSLSCADLGIVSIREDSIGCVAPSKLYGYLAAGKPLAVISPKNSYLKDLIAKKELGKWFENGNFKDLVSFIIELKNSKDLQKQLKANCLNYLKENASIEIISENYFKVIKKYL